MGNVFLIYCLGFVVVGLTAIVIQSADLTDTGRSLVRRGGVYVALFWPLILLYVIADALVAVIRILWRRYHAH